MRTSGAKSLIRSNAFGTAEAEAVPLVERLLKRGKPTGSTFRFVVATVAGPRLGVETICKVKASVEGCLGALTYEVG
jgi:hypothetical protein